MLDVCAPGWSDKVKVHRRWVYYGKLRFMLPLGKHGAGRNNPELEIGHVRGMARHFGIMDCAKKQIELLR